MPTPWRCLEQIPGLLAVPKIWQGLLGEHFEPFNAAFFQNWSRLASSFPCPLQTSCAYWLTHQPNGSILGVCQRDPRTCEDVTLTPAEVTPLQLNWARLGRALCKALNCESKPAELGLPSTLQIGAWSADAVPVILTIQSESNVFRHVIAELVARLGRPFILLAPTSLHMTANCDELLAHAKAAFFPLETTVTMTDHGTLHPTKTPGVIFARFTPEAKEPIDEDTARRAVALINQFDRKIRPPSLITVFRMYCMDELSAEAIARKKECSKAAVVRRLKMIRKITGTAPANLRRLSAHLQKLEDAVSDPRARRIYRKGAVEADDETQDGG